MVLGYLDLSKILKCASSMDNIPGRRMCRKLLTVYDKKSNFELERAARVLEYFQDCFYMIHALCE